MPLSFLKTVEPATEPITLAEARAHLRVDDTSEDTYITALITVAREHAEALTDRQFITATYALSMDEFPRRSCDVIRPPRPRLIGVSSISYLDTDNAAQVLSAASYQVDTVLEPGRILPGYALTWPDTYPVMNAVTITYTAGYGATATAVPKAIKQAILMLVAHWFEQREPVVIGTIATEVPMTVKALLGPYRVATCY